MSSKLDVSIMNQEVLCRFVVPGDKVIKSPSEMPSLPINILEELDRIEKFLTNDNNLTGAVSTIFIQYYMMYPLAKLVTF